MTDTYAWDRTGDDDELSENNRIPRQKGISGPKRQKLPKASNSLLSPREREAVTYAREGKRNAEVALLMECKITTVKVLIRNARMKAGTNK